MKIKTLLFFIFLSFFVFFSHHAFADESTAATPTGFGFSFGAWVEPNFSGITVAGGGGTEISLNHNLGLTGRTLFIPELWYRFSHGQILDIRYAQLNQTVTQNLNAPERFQSINFVQGAPETTTMNISWADISYELPVLYDKYPPQNSYLNAFLQFKIMNGTFTMTDQFGNVSRHPPIIAPFPFVGLHGKFQIMPGTFAEFKVSGIYAGFQDAIGYGYDIEGGISQRISNSFGVDAKYRNYTFYNRDSERNIFAFRLYGPEVDASFHF